MDDAIAILGKFVLAFMTYKRAEERDEIIASLVEGLEDVPEDVLRAACEKLTRSEEHMPTLAVIRRTARQVVLETTNQYIWGDLVAEQSRLTLDLYSGQFDPVAWNNLAVRMERAGMIYTAAQLRDRAGHYADISAAFTRVTA